MKFRLKMDKGAFRLRSRYLLSIVNENSLAPVFEVSARHSGLILTVIGVFALLGALWYVIFAYTPLNALMPEKFDPALRDQYVDMAIKVDSLAAVVALNDQYARNIEALLGDSLPEIPTDSASTNFYDLPLDSLLTAGKAEERFVSQFEASERFNLSVLAPIAADGMIFYPPVSDVPLKSNAAPSDLPSVTIPDYTHKPVSAVYRGTVVDAYYTSDKGVTVVIQHPNNFLSQYSGLGDVFVSRGAKVAAGQRVGISAGSRYPLTFSLWHDGSPLDPGDYIDVPLKVKGKR